MYCVFGIFIQLSSFGFFNSVILSYSYFIFLTLGEGAFENDPIEGGSQSAGVQAEVFNMSQHFPDVQKALVFTFSDLDKDVLYRR